MENNKLITALITVLIGITVAQSQLPGAATYPTDGLIINFNNAPLEEVLNYLSEKASLIIMSDMYLSSERISIVSRQPMSVDEIIGSINTILKEKNYAAVRTERTLRIVNINSAKHMNIPVSSGNNPDKLAGGDHLITHIIPVRYADAIKLQDNLTQLVPDYAVLSANESSNSILITDTASNVKRLITIISSLDTQMSSMLDVKVFRLEFGSASNVADMLNSVFETDTTATGTTRAVNPFERMRGMMGGTRGDTSSNNTNTTGGLNVRVKAAADDNTNTVVVTGPSDTLVVIDRVIKELDIDPNTQMAIYIYRLKNAKSANIKEILNNLFDKMQDLTGTNTNTRNNRNPNTAMFLGNTEQSSSNLSEEVYIESDEDTNSLLVMTSERNYERLKPIIDELDALVPQVLIKVLLAEITVNDDFDLGTEFSILNMRDSGGSTLFGSDYSLSTETGGLITRTIEGDLDFTIRALQEVGKLNVLSRPYILTSNNQTATITVGQEVPFITDTRTTDTGQTINTIQYRDIGIILEVTPTINPDGLVTMDVSPEISTTTAYTVPISEKVNASVYAKRSSRSRIAILDGQTIVIGGLMQDQERDSVQKVPLIGDIPLLGELFKRTIKNKEKTELLIFLTPQVATGDSELKGISNHERKSSRELNLSEANTSLKEYMEAMEATYKDTHK